MLESFTLAPGFRAAATACGLKTSSAMAASSLDLALVTAEAPCSAAGLFTSNRVKAAPVLYDQETLAQNAGAIRAVITNAGNANAVTGEQGLADARQMAALTAYGLRCQPDQVLVLSTGVIGRPMAMDKVTQGIAVVTSPAAEQGAAVAARAIMTTDTRPKTAMGSATIGSAQVTVSGFCKGAGMIHPDMATMLAIVTTDAQVAPDVLHSALKAAADVSFNRISVDGDTSTNDTLLLLASGVSGVAIGAGSAEFAQFVALLSEICTSLAKQVARDGEGATRLIEIVVSGAEDVAQAHTVANTIAISPLLKTAVHGGDPNWGRVLMAAGRSGAAIDPNRLTLAFGPPEREIIVLRDGMPASYVEREAAALFREDPVFIRLDLGLGSAQTTVWTCDFSKEYVEINAHYTT
ncbi:ornithine acetyltransferase [Kouleothrix aurantiaca]|uniref:Arginine biosynthesis bifunctional protein ArgJ n=1 Tax=Kouleothrix aurantiaca TaxID=186479 RepID=A0A0P9FF05_9CHLR|nr:ornithine acetyltransferase [Kouleothrix aurantiaca]